MAKRLALCVDHPSAAVYPLTWRPDFLGKRKSLMECQWTVWRPHVGGTIY